MLRNFISGSIISTVLVIFNPLVAVASTTEDYSSPCKYFNSDGNLQASNTCNVNFGTLSVAGGARFIVTFPNGAEIVVILPVDGEAETNGIPSDIAIAGGNVVVATEQGEIFIFRSLEQ